MYVDTHSHLNDEAFKDDLEEVIDKCLSNNVCKLIVVGFNKATNAKALDLAHKYPFIYASVGLHPCDVDEYTSFDLICEQLKDEKVVAIGECGLDYYWNKENISKQKEIFLKQMELAFEYKKPILIHSREAVQDTYDMLKAFNKPLFGIMHGYSGSVEMSKLFINLGFKLGIGGVVTFKNAHTIKEVVKSVSLKDIVLETDCPYLTPHPYRGKRNDSSFIPLIAKEIANIKGVDEEVLMDETTKNANELFGGIL